MRKKTVALYDPYLDTLGGGEKHALSILKVLSQEGYQPVIFWDQDLSQKITEKLHLEIKDGLKFEKNIFKNSAYSTLKKMKALAEYDIFIYMTDGSYFFSTAKKNVIFSLVPDRSLFSMSVLNRVKTINAQFVTNSRFSQHHLDEWGISAKVLYPSLEKEMLDFDPSSVKKEKIILSVGRFFKHLHAKRQDIMIEYFKKLKNEVPEINSYTLILAGGLKDEDQDYFKELQTLIGDDSSIQLRTNISYTELTDLYKKSEIYWHFAGFGADVTTHPERTEHFGITPIEAMSYGCTAFCYRAGGLKETIQDDITGYLFSSYDELKTKLQSFLKKSDHSTMQNAAKVFINKTFRYDVFKENVDSIFLK